MQKYISVNGMVTLCCDFSKEKVLSVFSMQFWLALDFHQETIAHLSTLWDILSVPILLLNIVKPVSQVKGQYLACMTEYCPSSLSLSRSTKCACEEFQSNLTDKGKMFLKLCAHTDRCGQKSIF